MKTTFQGIGWCPAHQKVLFNSRKRARRARHAMSESGMRAYPCEHVRNHWHVGHLPKAVRRGDATEAEVYHRG